MRTKTRLRGDKQFRLPTPGKNGESYEVKSLDMADGRYSVVKRLRQRLSKLTEETNADTVAKDVLCNRAMFLLAYLESAEIRFLSAKKMDWSTYLKVLRQLTDVLAKLGLDRAAGSAKTLASYLESQKTKTKKVRRG